MKAIILGAMIIAGLLFGACGHGKRPGKERTIEVTGSAEKEITPDEVYFSVTMMEYKKGNKKVGMDELETLLLKKAIDLGIKKQDLRLENTSSYGYYNYYWYPRKHDDHLATKTFTIKLDKPETIEKLLNSGDSLNYTSAHISRFDNSKKQAYRDTLKVQALKAARRKAEMLLNSVGEGIGEIQTITEIETPQNNYPYYGYWGYYGGTESNMASNESSVGSSGQGGGNAAFRDMKLRYEMKVVFRIK